MSPKVLVIDDDEMTRHLIELILQREGIEVESASDGQTGIEKVHTASPDLVILDYVMPDMDGVEVCRRIRAFSTVPILFLSVLDLEREQLQALEWVDNYLLKPFKIDELRTHVQDLLDTGKDH